MCYSEGSAMNRQQFLEQLEAELSGLAPVERQEALKFYVEYLDEAGPENEAAVLAELGSPQKVAAIIRANLGLSDESAVPHETPKPSLTLNGPDWSRKTEQQAQSGAPGAGSAAYGGQPFPKSKNNSRVLLVLLLVFTSPLWIGILGGLFGALMGLLGGILGIFIGGISAIAGGAIALIFSLFTLVGNPADGMVSMALSMASIAIGVLLTAGCVWLLRRFVPWLVSLVRRAVQAVCGKVGK